MDVGQVLRALRDELGLSQVQLARQLGTAPSTLNRYESGARLPSLRWLDDALARCGKDVRLTLVERHADLEAEFARRAALAWNKRAGARELMRPHFLTRLLDGGVDLVVAGEWAAELHGVPTEPGDGLLLVDAGDIEVLAATFMQGFVPWRESDGHFGSSYVRSETFQRHPQARWFHPDVGTFRTSVLQRGDAWPAEQRVVTAAGPLRVLAAEELTPDDGVTPEVLAAWLAWRRRTAST